MPWECLHVDAAACKAPARPTAQPGGKRRATALAGTGYCCSLWLKVLRRQHAKALSLQWQGHARLGRRRSNGGGMARGDLQKFGRIHARGHWPDGWWQSWRTSALGQWPNDWPQL
mmetsp:Transcript_41034/g.112973  ORF Transcript_41034/g.112973 Transcript_41034/m.112973 type:complete len:115 (-) Transcript_41034:1795-2139(-)